MTGAAYRSVSARTAHRSGRPHEDLVSAVAELSSGLVVTHLVNWLSPFKERVTTVTGDLGSFVADTLTADLTLLPERVASRPSGTGSRRSAGSPRAT